MLVEKRIVFSEMTFCCGKMVLSEKFYSDLITDNFEVICEQELWNGLLPLIKPGKSVGDFFFSPPI